MRNKTLNRYAKTLALALVALAVAVAPSFAQTNIDLCASDGTVTIDGVVVPIWGYAELTGGDTCTTGLATLPGPVLRPTPGDTTLTVTLHNALADAVSIFIPGLPKPLTPVVVPDGAGRERLVSFDKMVLSNSSDTYTWNLKPGTYLYESGTDVRTQVPMGLYGALVVDAAADLAYPSVPYTQDEVVVFSEIDPALNDNPAGFGGARVTTWRPQYFLINGKAYPDTTIAPFTTGDVLLRFVNAGLDMHSPTLGGGLYAELIAEDGNLYPYPFVQYGLELPPSKTIDAMITVSDAGTYALYDRALSLTNGSALGGGMLAYLDVSAGAGVLELSAATYTVDENVPGGLLTVTVNRVGGSTGAVSVDYETADGTATAGSDYTGIVVTTLNFAAGVTTGTFDIPILPDTTYEGDETFTVTLSNPTGGASLGTPASAVVTINEDDAGPGALQINMASYVVAENVAGGILTVTVDRVDGSAGAVSVDYATTNGTATAGSDYTAVPVTTLNFADGVLSQTFDVTIVNDSTYEGDETFNVVLSNAIGATLGTPASAVVTITEDDAAPNVAPFANDDFAETPRGTAVNVNVVANDVDPDGTIDPASVVLTTGAVSQRGGTVVNNGDGTVTYTPPNPGFRGTDTFQYTVNDDDGATSNVATVRVNVVR